LPVGSLPTAMTHPLRSTSITPASTLLQGSPPLSGASVLSPSRWSRLRLFPSHRRPGSHVPYQSQIELRAAYMLLGGCLTENRAGHAYGVSGGRNLTCMLIALAKAKSLLHWAVSQRVDFRFGYPVPRERRNSTRSLRTGRGVSRAMLFPKATQAALEANAH
jgi:hypothetical protein